MTTDSAAPIPILFCITELNNGGAERALVEIVTRLDRARWQPKVISLGPRGELVDNLEQAGIEVVCLDACCKLDFRILFRLIREIRSFRPRILQTFLFHANLVGRIAGVIARVPKIVGGIRVAEKRGGTYLLLDRWTEGMVNRQVCVSESVRQFAITQVKLSPQKLVTIPNGIDVERFQQATPLAREEFGLHPEDLIALFVGRLDPQKGLDLLLEAAARLAEPFPQLKWLIVGQGSESARLRYQITEAGISDRVQLTGQRKDIPELMKMADLFVFPSRWEGMPNVILEAMVAGLPIVSSRVEGVEELLTDNVSAALFPPNSSEELIRTLSDLLNHPDRLQQFARQAQQDITDNHRWETVSKRYQDLYEELLGND